MVTLLLVPGPVSDLSGSPTQSSLEITWSAPEEPNGVIISYQITYRINNSNIIVVNTTGASTAFTIPSLTPGTRISNISVSAYTRAGRGQPAYLEDMITLDGICECSDILTSKLTFPHSIVAAINFVTIVGVVSSFLILIIIFVLVAVILTKVKL